jgi:uncharacterized protein (TIRG00374 family)
MKNKIISFYKKNRKTILLFFRIAISVSLIAYLIGTQFKDLKNVVDILKTANIYLLVLSLSIHIFGVWITAVRWKTLLDTQKAGLGARTLTVSVLIGFFFNNFLPTSIGGDVFRAYDASKKGKIQIGTSASTILVERFSGVIAAATYAIVALFLGFTAIGNQSVIIPIVIFFVITIILAFLIINPSILRMDRFFDRFRILRKLKGKLSDVYKTLQSFKKYKMALVKILVFSFLLQFAVILNYYLAAKALGIELGLASFLFIVPVVTIIAMLPISIGGAGLRENSLVIIMVALGAANDKATLVSLLTFIMLIIVGIIGGITYNIRPYIKARTIKNGELKENS